MTTAARTRASRLSKTARKRELTAAEMAEWEDALSEIEHAQAHYHLGPNSGTIRQRPHPRCTYCRHTAPVTARGRCSWCGAPADIHDDIIAPTYPRRTGMLYQSTLSLTANEARTIKDAWLSGSTSKVMILGEGMSYRADPTVTETR